MNMRHNDMSFWDYEIVIDIEYKWQVEHVLICEIYMTMWWWIVMLWDVKLWTWGFYFTCYNSMNNVVVLWFLLLVEFLFINLDDCVLSWDNLISLFRLVLFWYLRSECEPFTIENVFIYYVFYELLISSTFIFLLLHICMRGRGCHIKWY